MECKLTYLGLNGNQLTRIPRRLLIRCPHLFHLNLGYNQISHLDDFLHLVSGSSNIAGGGTRFRRLRYLSTLILRNNPIRTLAHSFSNYHQTGRNVRGNSNANGSNSDQLNKIDGAHPNEINQASSSSSSNSGGNNLGGNSNEVRGNNNNNLPMMMSSPTDSNELLQTSPTTLHPVNGHVHGRGKSNNQQLIESLASTSMLANIFHSEVFPNLRELSLSFCKLSGELEPFPSLPLTTLEISMGLKSATTLHPALFNALKNLEWLALDYNSLVLVR